MDSPLLTAALRYAELGWSVLPLCPAHHEMVGKAHARGCDSPGKRPFNPTLPEAEQGEWKLRQATAMTVDELRACWEANPHLNVGVALGPVSGMVAIDIDDAEGEELLGAMSNGDLPTTWEYTTGKGARILYRLPVGVTVPSDQYKRPNTKTEILRLMTVGGQVVLPPSVHPKTGLPYEWVTGKGPGELPMGDVPNWWRTIKRQSAKANTPADGEIIIQGGRHDYLLKLAGAMRRVGADEETMFAGLSAFNEGRCDPVWPEHLVRNMARSVAKYPPSLSPTAYLIAPTADAQGNAVDGWTFKWASQLDEHKKETEWLWEGYIPSPGICLLSAYWKAGKTTLLGELVKELGRSEIGQYLGLTIRPAKVLYVTEEMEQHWSRRRDKLGLGDHVAFHIQPFAIKPDMATWAKFILQIREDVQNEGFGLVVFDTLTDLWPVMKENDAGEVQAALAVLRTITRAGAAVLMVHHMRKGAGGEYTGSRGSGVLCSFPDILMEMSRVDAEGNNENNRRVLNAKGRYEETPNRVELLWNKETGFTRIDAVEIKPTGPQLSDADKVISVLPDAEELAMAKPAIQDALQEKYGSGVRAESLPGCIIALLTDGLIGMTGGTNTRHDPKRYYLKLESSVVPSDSAPVKSTGTTDGND